MIIKVSVVIIDGVRWEQNGGMLIWLGGNVLGCPLVVGSDGGIGPDAV